MRKDTWFRGPLLSVLFFALLIGGAPTMAAADLQSVSAAHTSPSACNSNGGTWVGSGSAGNPNGYCDYGSPDDTGVGSPAWCALSGAALGALAFDAAGAAAMAGMGATMFTPVGWGIGIFALGVGLYAGYQCADNWFGG